MIKPGAVGLDSQFSNSFPLCARSSHRLLHFGFKLVGILTRLRKSDPDSGVSSKPRALPKTAPVNNPNKNDVNLRMVNSFYDFLVGGLDNFNTWNTRGAKPVIQKPVSA